MGLSVRRTLVVGGGRGVGRSMVDACLARGDDVWATVREPSEYPDLVAQLGRQRVVALDVEDESSVARAFEQVSAPRLHLLVSTVGLLHDGLLQPEKRLEHVDPAHLSRLFAVNSIGPLLLAKYGAPLLKHPDRAVFASLSARVGSIGDNRLGGWYGYRASKAAQNMALKTLSIEWSRRAKNVIVAALHPGTVRTDLSAPFRANVPPHKLFSSARAATCLLGVMDGLRSEDSGGHFAWDGSPIPW
jgi:NAD(P)-dependent dehydrogenase (short-subunit alcohol dehydrogenase family)